MSDEEAPAEGGEGAGDEAAAAPDTTTAPAVDTTTAGARMMMNHPWLTAAAVALYATKVMWVKFRAVGLDKQKRRPKNRQDKKSKPQDNEDNGSESESEADTDAEDAGEPKEAEDLPADLDADEVDPLERLEIAHRSIEVLATDH